VGVTEKTPDSASPPDAGDRGDLVWANVRRRLDVSRATLQRKLAPGVEEKRKILQHRALLLAASSKADVIAPGSLLEIVEFVLGPERYGIESSRIREIYPLNEYTPLPCTPAFVLGLVNVRGQILSIINLKKLFDLPEDGLTDLNKIIIVHAHSIELGVLADAIVGTRSIAREDLHPALPTLTGIRADYLQGITKDSLVVLDAGKILADERILVHEVVNGAT
jgi:purine-binding chemotaxis protein CheW